jgi:hypothetical protein
LKVFFEKNRDRDKKMSIQNFEDTKKYEHSKNESLYKTF